MKTTTSKEYHKALNKTIDYINTHLHETLTIKDIAAVSCISSFHFHRIFKAYIGESIGAYISRLRLERAAQKLQRTELRLIEIAERTGYQSQHSLSKAFKQHFGISPSAFKNVQHYLPEQFTTKASEKITQSPRIEKIPLQHLAYVRIIAKYGESVAYKDAWDKLTEYAKTKHLLTPDTSFIGLSFDNPNITLEERCRFYASITLKQPITTEGAIGTYTLEEGLFAVFILKGSYSKLNTLYPYIYFEWLPNSIYELREAMPFEKYLNSPEDVSENDLRTEIHIPIKEETK